MRKKLVSLMLALCLLPLGSLAEVEVVASLFPQFDFARAIAGERAHVSQLLPPGQDSHGYEPSMRELLALGDADLFLFTGEAMEPWAASLVGGMEDGPAIVDVSAGVSAESGHEAAEGGDEHSHDAHIWLNPLNAITMCENICDALIGIDPEGGRGIRRAFHRPHAVLRGQIRLLALLCALWLPLYERLRFLLRRRGAFRAPHRGDDPGHAGRGRAGSLCG